MATTVGVFLTGVLSAYHVSRVGPGEAGTSSGQQLACCLQQHFLGLFPIFTLILYRTQSQLEFKKKKKSHSQSISLSLSPPDVFCRLNCEVDFS